MSLKLLVIFYLFLAVGESKLELILHLANTDHLPGQFSILTFEFLVFLAFSIDFLPHAGDLSFDNGVVLLKVFFLFIDAPLQKVDFLFKNLYLLHVHAIFEFQPIL